MTSMQLVKIDTSDRINPLTTSASQCVIHSNAYTFRGVYALAYVCIPITFFNITTSNNLLYFTDTVSRIATIPIGFYDTVTILPVLALAMNAASNTTVYAVPKLSATKCLTIASSINPFVLNLSITLNSIASQLGFISMQDTLSASSITSDIMPNMAKLKWFNININGLSSVISLSGKAASSFIVPITEGTPAVMLYEPTTFTQTINFERPTRDIHLSVCDEDSNIIQFLEDFFIILRPVCH